MSNPMDDPATFAQLHQLLTECDAAQTRLNDVKSFAMQTPHALDPDVLRIVAEKQLNIDETRDLCNRALDALVYHTPLK